MPYKFSSKLHLFEPPSPCAQEVLGFLRRIWVTQRPCPLPASRPTHTYSQSKTDRVAQFLSQLGTGLAKPVPASSCRRAQVAEPNPLRSWVWCSQILALALNSLNKQAEFRECADFPDLKYLPFPRPIAERAMAA